MPTKNLRINITFEPEIATILASIAQQKQISLSCLAKEHTEDVALSEITKIRDIETMKPVSHAKAWK